ncbi:MAG: PT domain-containing protein [Anaerolineae bacterium]|nr:PT domain-containing protein [Anaerolineae bacterium]
MQPTRYPTNQPANQPTSQPANDPTSQLSILSHPCLPYYINRAGAARSVAYSGQ